jgi:hypothetical protein
MSLKRQIGSLPKHNKQQRIQHQELMNALLYKEPRRVFVVLEGYERGDRFITIVDGQTDEQLVRTVDSRVSYNILGFAETMQEAQENLYGGRHVSYVF